MGEFSNDPYDVPLILDMETFIYLARILKVSHRLRISILQDVLKIQEEKSFHFIVDWAEQFGFIIDGDFIDFRSGNKDTFVKFLESHVPKSSDTLEENQQQIEKKNKTNSLKSIPLQCPICHQTIPIGSAICEECGNPINTTEEESSNNWEESYFCLKCGSELPKNSTQCQKCGYNYYSKTWLNRHEDLTQQTGHCKFCGAKLRQNSVICNECGYDSELGIQKTVIYVDQNLLDELHKAEEKEDLFMQAMVCNKIGLRFKSIKQYADAVYYYKKAMVLLKKMGAEESLLSDIIRKNLSLIEL